MTEAILVALITGGLALAGTVVTGRASSRAMEANLDKQLAVMRTELEELTREVRQHNNFAQRIPVAEEQIKSAKRRIEDLERSVEKYHG